jgi:hypothetical protein
LPRPRLAAPLAPITMPWRHLLGVVGGTIAMATDAVTGPGRTRRIRPLPSAGRRCGRPCLSGSRL